ncbi:MAG: hypothetical protein ABI986_04985 [Chloroflexota bacterium]
MNTHLNEGQLRAALDGEVNTNELEHLTNCTECQARQKEIESQFRFANDKLAFLSSATNEARLSSSSAFYRFNQQRITQKETSMFKKLFKAPLVRYGVPALLVLTMIFAFPSARAFASELLNLFRIQQVAVVPIDFTGMQSLDGAVGNDIGQLISNSITMTKKPGDPVDAADAAQASQLSGFNVRVPQDQTPSHISVMNGSDFTLTVDREKAQALINEAGRSDLVLPDAIDGAKISVTIPSSVSVDFGTCPPPSADGDGPNLNGHGSPGRQYADCIILAEVPSPSVSAPASVDVAQLAQIALEFSGMTSDQAKAFTDTVDWTSTLVVPIPKNAASYEQVSVDGVTGTLIQRPSDDAPQFLLLWVKDGIIYAIGGLGSNSQQAIQIANSLQ